MCVHLRTYNVAKSYSHRLKSSLNTTLRHDLFLRHACAMAQWFRLLTLDGRVEGSSIVGTTYVCKMLSLDCFSSTWNIN